MPFRYDWTSDRIPNWLNYMQDLVGRENVVALEIGAFEGRTTVWMLEHILTHPTSRVVCLDPFVPNAGLATTGELSTDDYFPRFTQNTETFRKRVRVLQAYSKEIDADFLLQVENGYDLIYIDASHFPDETVYETKLALAVSNPGAFIVFDDYGGTLRERVDEYLDRFVKSGRVKVLHQAYQMIIQRAK